MVHGEHVVAGGVAFPAMVAGILASLSIPPEVRTAGVMLVIGIALYVRAWFDARAARERLEERLAQHKLEQLAKGGSADAGGK